MTTPARDDVLDVVRAAVVAVLGTDRAVVQEPARLREDLGADSLALAEIAEIAGRRLSARVPGFAVADDDLDGPRTVGELVDLAVTTIARLGAGGA